MTERAHALWALSLVGCVSPAPADPTSDLPPLEWKGDHVEFGSDLVDEVCLGTLELLDHDIEAIEATLGLEPVDDRIAFRVISDFDDRCSGWFLGCAQGDEVFTSGTGFRGAHRHELVHARLARERPSVKTLFEEGMATELGGLAEGCSTSDACTSTSLDQLLVASGSDELLLSGYFAGADLIHGILLAEGSSATLAFTTEIHQNLSPDDVRAKYHEHFGRALDVDFEDYKRGVLDDYTPASVGCESTPAPRDEVGGLVLEAEMECGSTDVANDFAAAQDGIRDRGIIEWSFVIDPEQSGAFVLTGAIEKETDLQVLSCSPRTLSGPVFRGGQLSFDDDPLVLGPGLYRIAWTDILDVGATLDIILAPPCTFEAQDCPAGQRCTIWNLCEAEGDQPAGIGEACEQAVGDPLACIVGARCLGSVCVPECDATQPCPDGEGCAQIRVCGTPCDLLAQDCENGFNCVPSSDPHAAQAGQGQCIPTGQSKIYDACDPRDGTCREGLHCESVPLGHYACDSGELGGCCLPYCDPTANDSGCPANTSGCYPILDGVVGVCK